MMIHLYFYLDSKVDSFIESYYRFVLTVNLSARCPNVVNVNNPILSWTNNYKRIFEKLNKGPIMSSLALPSNYPIKDM